MMVIEILTIEAAGDLYYLKDGKIRTHGQPRTKKQERDGKMEKVRKRKQQNR